MGKPRSVLRDSVERLGLAGESQRPGGYFRGSSIGAGADEFKGRASQNEFLPAAARARELSVASFVRNYEEA